MARFVALSTHEVTWQGTAAHAQTPWQGVSALDASVTAYQSIALLRSQLPPGSSVHGILGSCDDSLVESPYVTTSSAMLGTSPSSHRSNSSSPPLSGAAGVSLRQRAFYCSAVVSRVRRLRGSWLKRLGNSVLRAEGSGHRSARQIANPGRQLLCGRLAFDGRDPPSNDFDNVSEPH